MASPEQILANRANAQLSTGPVTEEGKLHVSGNALSHGATSRQTVLPWESQEGFDALQDSLLASHNPQGEQEHTLTKLVAITCWRYQRVMGIEAAFMASVAPPGTEHLAGPEQIVFDLFLNPVGQKRLNLVLRYLANASREWRYAIAELAKVQKLRRLNGPTSVEEGAEEEHQTEPEEITYLSRTQRRANERANRKAEKKARRQAPAIGFVSQPTPFDPEPQHKQAA